MTTHDDRIRLRAAGRCTKCKRRQTINGRALCLTCYTPTGTRTPLAAQLAHAYVSVITKFRAQQKRAARREAKREQEKPKIREWARAWRARNKAEQKAAFGGMSAEERAIAVNLLMKR